MTDTESFADTPQSITELKSERSGFAKDMTARDVIVMFLRDLDSGRIDRVDFLCICYAKRKDDMVLVNEYAGGPHNPLEMFGLLERCKLNLISDSHHE